MPVTATAQAIGTLLNANPADLLTVVLSTVAALAALAVAHQAILEGAIAKFLPSSLFWVKPFLPLVTSSILGAIADKVGHIPGVDAASGAAVLAGLTHAWNSTPWAARLESKVKDAAPAAAKAAAILAAALMLCLGPKLCPAAELGLSQSAVLGSGLYRPQSDGSLVSSGGAAVGYQLNASLGSLSGTAWTNYVSLSLGAALETAPLTYGGSDIEEFGDLAWGIGTGVGNIIPGVSNTSILLGGFTRVLGARAYDTTSYGFSANWSFGTPFWTDK